MSYMVDPDIRDPFFANADRQTRRAIFADERRERSTGKWSPWEKNACPIGRIDSLDPDGWTRDVHTVFKNRWLVVLVRDCMSAMGIVQHAAMVTALRAELHWKETQRVKDELFGVDRLGIEVYPSNENLVDAAMMFHLWILPADFRLPFGLGKADPCSHRHYRPAL